MPFSSSVGRQGGVLHSGGDGHGHDWRPRLPRVWLAVTGIHKKPHVRGKVFSRRVSLLSLFCLCLSSPSNHLCCVWFSCSLCYRYSFLSLSSPSRSFIIITATNPLFPAIFISLATFARYEDNLAGRAVGRDFIIPHIRCPHRVAMGLLQRRRREIQQRLPLGV